MCRPSHLHSITREFPALADSPAAVRKSLCTDPKGPEPSSIVSDGQTAHARTVTSLKMIFNQIHWSASGQLLSESIMMSSILQVGGKRIVAVQVQRDVDWCALRHRLDGHGFRRAECSGVWLHKSQ